jgi:hypothetical protein
LGLEEGVWKKKVLNSPQQNSVSASLHPYPNEYSLKEKGNASIKAVSKHKFINYLLSI